MIHSIIIAGLATRISKTQIRVLLRNRQKEAASAGDIHHFMGTCRKIGQDINQSKIHIIILGKNGQRRETREQERNWFGFRADQQPE